MSAGTLMVARLGLVGTALLWSRIALATNASTTSSPPAPASTTPAPDATVHAAAPRTVSSSPATQPALPRSSHRGASARASVQYALWLPLSSLAGGHGLTVGAMHIRCAHWTTTANLGVRKPGTGDYDLWAWTAGLGVRYYIREAPWTWFAGSRTTATLTHGTGPAGALGAMVSMNLTAEAGYAWRIWRNTFIAPVGAASYRFEVGRLPSWTRWSAGFAVELGVAW